MTKNLLGFLILLLIALQLSAQDTYPKKLIIPSFKGSDTVIAFTNEQVIKFNQEHVILKQCIEYSNVQDSIISSKQLEINKLENIKNTALKSDSISRETIEIQEELISLKDKHNQELKKTFEQYQKDARKQRLKSLLGTTFVTTPVVFLMGFLASFFVK